MAEKRIGKTISLNPKMVKRIEKILKEKEKWGENPTFSEFVRDAITDRLKKKG